MSENKYLTIEQVCDRLTIHRNTVEHWLRSGKLKGYRFGKLWRVKETDLEAMAVQGKESKDGKST
jgi:excisionase family DNA binding protein